jgi:predicted nucleic acid-binding protein
LGIAITDACIFIDLHSLEIISLFFGLNIEVHTSYDVINELYPYQKEILLEFEIAGKLVIHNITENDRRIIYTQTYPKSLSDNDKTVIHLAVKLDAILLSSDKAVRRFAKSISIEYHGMLWILDQMVENDLLPNVTACEKLKKLIMTNQVYQNNIELVEQMNNRLNKWR